MNTIEQNRIARACRKVIALVAEGDETAVLRAITRLWQIRPGNRRDMRRIKWTPELDALLTRKPDYEVARLIGCFSQSVAQRRSRLGLPPSRSSFRRLRDEHIPLLGTMPDLKLMQITGASISSIQRKRSQLGIAPFGPGRRRGDKKLNGKPIIVDDGVT